MDIIAHPISECKHFFQNFSVFLEGPLAALKDADGLAIGADGIDVHGVAADHEVGVDHGVVDTQGSALLQGAVVVVGQAVLVAHAHGQVADGILIIQGVEEQQAALVDGEIRFSSSASASSVLL